MLSKAKIRKNRLRRALPLLVLGFVASYTFVVSVIASDIAPSSVISLVNQERAEANLAPLAENTKLSAAARAKANDMIKRDYFAHTSPAGVTPWQWIKQAGYRYKTAGENLAVNYTSAKEQHKAWMKSPTHRANILNPKYQEIGVAVVEGKIDGEESIVTVQMFGMPIAAVADQTAKTPPVVAKAPAVSGAENEVPTPVVDSNTSPVIEPQVLLVPGEGELMREIEQIAETGSNAPQWFEVAIRITLFVVIFSALAGPILIFARSSREWVFLMTEPKTAV
jgi:hypothetical protein